MTEKTTRRLINGIGILILIMIVILGVIKISGDLRDIRRNQRLLEIPSLKAVGKEVMPYANPNNVMGPV
jgi:hypothetical protein